MENESTLWCVKVLEDKHLIDAVFYKSYEHALSDILNIEGSVYRMVEWDHEKNGKVDRSRPYIMAGCTETDSEYDCHFEFRYPDLTFCIERVQTED